MTKILKYVIKGVINLLKYLRHYRLIREVIFYEDQHNTLPTMALKYPTLFTDNGDGFQFEISIQYHCELREGKCFEFAM